jgi:hypothetical protein
MAIGTSVKVGFDGSEVKKGFAGIGGAFKTIGKGMAIGAGAMLGKSLIDVGIKLATGIDQLADFAGAAQDTALQVGSSTTEIIKLDRALELAGTGLGDAGTILLKMKDSIYEMTHDGQDLQKAFGLLGLTFADLRGKTVIEQFRVIGDSMKAMGENSDDAEKAINEIFGNKIYKGLLKLFKNQDVFGQAGDELQIFGEEVETVQDKLGKMQDQFQRVPYLWRSLNLQLFKQLGLDGSTLKDFFDATLMAINEADWSKFGDLIRKQFQGAMDFFKETGAVDAVKVFFNEIGKSIGEGIRSSFGGGSILDMINPFKGDKTKTSMIDPISEIQRTNSLLEKIYRTGGALYA